MSDTLNNQGTRYELDGSIIMDEVEDTTPKVDTDADSTGEDDSVSEDSQTEESEDDVIDEGTEPSLESLQAMTTSLEWLRDIKYTISREGVSRADMQALAKIRSHLVTQGVELAPTPSLEDYAMATYLEERAGVNVSVAVESFASTMIATIKRWIAKLVEYVGQMVRWVAKEFMGEDAVKRKLTGKHKQILALQELRQRLFSIHSPTSLLAQEMDDQAGLLLSDDNLRNNRMTVAAFGSVTEDKIITDLVKKGTDTTKTMVSEIGNLKKDLESDSPTTTFDDKPIESLALRVIELDEFLKDQPNEQYVRQQLENRLFTDALPGHVLTVTPFNDLVQSYRKVHGDLKQIRKIDHHQDVDRVVGQLNDLMRAIGNISKLASGVKQYNNHKLQALRQRAAFETIYINRYYQSVKATTDDKTMASIKRTIESARSKINGLGVDNT